MIQNPLTVVTAYHAGDIDRTKELYKFISELGGAKPHCCLLVADAAITPEQRKEIAAIARKSFDVVMTIPNSVKATWAPNSMFLSAAKWIEQCTKLPWLWLESDCTPMREGWADQIMEEYESSPMKFLGPQVPNKTDPSLPAMHLTGTAVYPCDAYSYYKDIETLTNKVCAWDIEAAAKIAPCSKASARIAHFYGGKDTPPHFVESKSADDPQNFVELSFVPKQAAIFHRVKDLSLINLLRKSRKTKKTE